MRRLEDNLTAQLHNKWSRLRECHILTCENGAICYLGSPNLTRQKVYVLRREKKLPLILRVCSDQKYWTFFCLLSVCVCRAMSTRFHSFSSSFVFIEGGRGNSYGFVDFTKQLNSLTNLQYHDSLIRYLNNHSSYI